MESMAQCEMPRYRCHKEVWALKIKELRTQQQHCDFEADSGELLLVPEDERYAPFWLDKAFVEKHKPVAGGYYVVYKDGYKSFSPAQAFEEGYTRI